MKKTLRTDLLKWLAILFIAASPHFLFSETFVVTNTSDSGVGSLRQAFDNANATAGADTIIFNIPTTDNNYNATLGTWTIAPVSELPSLTDDSTFVDGLSQSDFMGYDTNPSGPEIEISGLNAGTASGITILSAYNVISALVVNNFQQFGIYIEYSNAHDNVVKGCYVGTDVTGSQDFGNGFSGILIYNYAKNNIIGGSSPGDGNVASGNGWAGIEIQGNGADSNLVIGNKVGTDATGMAVISNSRYGVYVWSFAAANIIGGSREGEGNVISGNGWTGISLAHADYSKIWGNIVGMDINGTTAIPNNNGIQVFGKKNEIGGNDPHQRNLVSGNSNNGISVGGDSLSIIAGNLIGTDISGTLPFPNGGNGVLLADNGYKNTVGPGNVICYNKQNGVKVVDLQTIENTITKNSISQNDSLGIQNIAGGNLELAPPVITGASDTEVTGNAPANSAVEIFSDSEDEGEIYEGATTADATGSFHWAGTLTGPNITATATDENGNTSEFSQPFTIMTNYAVSGYAKYYSNDEAIQNVNFALDGQTATTDEAGHFHFADVAGGNYTLTPDKTGDLGSSISAYDASMILRYVVDLIDLTPYQMIAADVSGNGAVTAFDASYVLRYVVGLISSFPAGAEWTFVPASFDLNEGNWTAAPGAISYSPLDSDQENQDFYGIVYGDVTGNWAAPSLGKQKSGFAEVEFGDIARQGNDFLVPVQINGSAEIFSSFLKIKFDSRILELKNVSLAENVKDFSMAHNVQGNNLLIALAGATPIILNDDVFYLNFRVKNKEKNTSLEISETLLNQGEVAVELKNSRLILKQTNPAIYALGQNYPNPFNSKTKINFSLAQESQVKIVVFDVNGREVRQLLNGKNVPGNHSTSWDMRDDRGNIVSSGVYFYKIEANALDGNLDFTKLRKMIVIK